MLQRPAVTRVVEMLSAKDVQTVRLSIAVCIDTCMDTCPGMDSCALDTVCRPVARRAIDMSAGSVDQFQGRVDCMSVYSRVRDLHRRVCRHVCRRVCVCV